MNLYDQLKKIAEREKAASAGTKHEYFTHYQEDLTVHDRDELENDSQAGDRYLWILKSNGCGTYMFRLNGGKSDILNTIHRASDSQCYLVKCSGINEGTVESITWDMAESVYYETPPACNRIPRRRRLYDQLNELLGIDDNSRGYRLQSTNMGSDFKPLPGDKSFLKLSMERRTTECIVRIDVLRPKMKEGHLDGLTRKPSAHYRIPATLTAIDLLADGAKYYSVDAHQAHSYATITEVSSRMYNAAERKINASAKTAFAQPSPSF